MTITLDALDTSDHRLTDAEPFFVRVALAINGVRRAYQVRCHTGIAPELGAALLEPDVAFRGDLAAMPRAKGRILQLVGRILAGERVSLPVAVDVN